MTSAKVYCSIEVIVPDCKAQAVSKQAASIWRERLNVDHGRR